MRKVDNRSAWRATIRSAAYPRIDDGLRAKQQYYLGHLLWFTIVCFSLKIFLVLQYPRKHLAD